MRDTKEGVGQARPWSPHEVKSYKRWQFLKRPKVSTCRVGAGVLGPEALWNWDAVVLLLWTAPELVMQLLQGSLCIYPGTKLLLELNDFSPLGVW